MTMWVRSGGVRPNDRRSVVHASSQAVFALMEIDDEMVRPQRPEAERGIEQRGSRAWSGACDEANEQERR
jgi:hypothetical protein